MCENGLMRTKEYPLRVFNCKDDAIQKKKISKKKML